MDSIYISDVPLKNLILPAQATLTHMLTSLIQQGLHHILKGEK